jgi:uncharacterized alkaline shock family protein YloU
MNERTKAKSPNLASICMKNKELNNLGQISINNSVVVQIVSLAAQEVTGVVAVSGSGFVDKVFSGKGSTGGVRVHEDEKGDYQISIPVVLSYGFELANVAYNIQTTVQDQVFKMTNKKVAKVNIIIDAIKMPISRPKEKEYEDQWETIQPTD